MKNMKDNLKQGLCDLKKARDVLLYSYEKCQSMELADELCARNRKALKP